VAIHAEFKINVNRRHPVTLNVMQQQEPRMSLHGMGEHVKRGIHLLIDTNGGPVLVHRQYGTPDQETFEHFAMKNHKKGRPDDRMFQFKERIDVQVGDVIQQKESRDVWRVIELEDRVQAGAFTCMEAKIEKLNAAPSRRDTQVNNVTIHGDNYGGVQVGTENSSQHTHTSVVCDSVDRLMQLVDDSDLADLDKEDATAELDRIKKLAERDATPEVLDRLSKRVNIFRNTVAGATGLATVIEPYIETIVKAFSG